MPFLSTYIDVRTLNFFPPTESWLVNSNFPRARSLQGYRTFDLKDVRAHCYCASLVRTLYMTWRLPRHVFQARAPNRNLICKYFCWMLGDPHFFFGRSLPFLILSIILNDKKNLCVGSFNYFSYTIQIGWNWYMDTGVRDLEVACFKANSTWINDIGSKDLSNRPIYAVLNTHNLDMILQLKYMPIVMNPVRIASSD